MIYRTDNPNFQYFLVKTTKITVTVNDIHFHNQPSVFQGACWVQTWLFEVCVELSCRQDKVYARMENDNDPSVRKVMG